MDHESRQRAVRDVLRKHISSEERQDILGFLIYTPEEMDLYSNAFEETQ